MVGATAGVMKSYPDGGVLAGFPARPQKEWMKAQASLQRIDGLRRKVRDLERRLSELESGEEPGT
jgi:UDP-3-O-[3-hydroxymyristoyl] glucosamine N-acyltransferase